MARINSYGLDDLYKTIEREAKVTPAMQDAMLKAGAAVLVDAMRDQIKRFDIWDLGATWWSIKSSMVKNRLGQRYIEVWPAGRRKDDKHPSGERIETVAFIAEYGTSKIPPRPFMSTAIRQSEERVAEEMMRVWRERDG